MPGAILSNTYNNPHNTPCKVRAAFIPFFTPTQDSPKAIELQLAGLAFLYAHSLALEAFSHLKTTMLPHKGKRAFLSHCEPHLCSYISAVRGVFCNVGSTAWLLGFEITRCSSLCLFPLFVSL